MEVDFNILPHETLISIFKFLDVRSLLQASLVCHEWHDIAQEPIIWRSMCKSSGRIIGKFTSVACLEYANLHGWKHTFISIPKSSLIEGTQKEILEILDKTEGVVPFLLFFRAARAADLFPNSPVILQEIADRLCDRPLERNPNYWNLAEECFTNSIEVFEKKQASKKLKLSDSTSNVPSEAKTEDEEEEKTYFYPLLLFRYSHFLISNRKDTDKANRLFHLIMKVLPRNTWVMEKYAEFLVEHRHRYGLASKVYSLVLSVSSRPSASSLCSYAFFLWQHRQNLETAFKCLRFAKDIDPSKIYFYTHFLSRVGKESLAIQEIKTSKLYEMAQNEELPAKVRHEHLFNLGLAFHQAHELDEAEKYYRLDLKISTPTLYSLSNLAELLLHGRKKFEEAKEIYEKALELAGGLNETVEMALATLNLAKGDNWEVNIAHLRKLLELSHIKTKPTTEIEGWIVFSIHCSEQDFGMALTNVKQRLYTNFVRPKLILMFEANLDWAKFHLPAPRYELVKGICQVYNCEVAIESLDDWKEWKEIEAEPPKDKGTMEQDVEEYKALTDMFFPPMAPQDPNATNAQQDANDEEQAEDQDDNNDEPEDEPQEEESVEESVEDAHLD